ncbi:MAG: cell wall-binding protein, partial [Actinobacteria bacterium]|nr:cell wall-binding protein [Actinomycetota bacterium]
TKEYNTFDGWNPEIPAYMPAENITVTAQWVTQTYTVTFADWDGSVIDVQTVPHGGNADLPSTPTRDGHSFLSWTGANYLNVTSDRTITASYGINTYTVTFQYEDETVIETVNVLYMQDATPPTPPVIEGLTFSEWLGDYEDVTENRTITAIYGADLYTVTFKDDDETTVLGTDVVAYGEDATPPSDPTKTGYTFDEWDGDFTNVTEDLTILATYNRNYYTVTYLDDDGTLLKTDRNVEHGTDSTPPADPTQEGKVFSGWDKSVLNIKEDTVITATYDLVVYTVTFEDYDTSFIAEYKVESGDASPEPAEPTRTGYTFTDWDVDFSNITEDLTVTAQYTINQYTLTYNVNRGTSVSAQEYDYNEALSLGSTTRVGYDFGGWYANSSLTTAFTLTNMPASDTTIYAKWTIQTFTVTFKDYDDSTIGTPQTINYGKTATAPTVSRTGYAFTGWSHSYSNVTADVTTTAQYAINKYSITFNRNGGSVVSPQTYDFGDTIVAPSNPTRTGYTFNGWSPSLPATMPSNNLTVTAQWTANQYTITFNSNGGSSVSSKT